MLDCYPNSLSIIISSVLVVATIIVIIIIIIIIIIRIIISRHRPRQGASLNGAPRPLGT